MNPIEEVLCSSYRIA